VETLLKVMVDPATPPATKVRAADSVLDHAAKAIEIEQLPPLWKETRRAGSGRTDYLLCVQMPNMPKPLPVGVKRRLKPKIR
jgi:hypothetical protein